MKPPKKMATKKKREEAQEYCHGNKKVGYCTMQMSLTDFGATVRYSGNRRDDATTTTETEADVHFTERFRRLLLCFSASPREARSRKTTERCFLTVNKWKTPWENNVSVKSAEAPGSISCQPLPGRSYFKLRFVDISCCFSLETLPVVLFFLTYWTKQQIFSDQSLHRSLSSAETVNE